MKKRFFAVLTATILLCACLPLGAVNVSAATSGKTGDCTWTLLYGHLTISGNGAMENYGRGEAPWKNANVTAVTIEKGVTTIGEFAFFECKNLKNVIIPESVTSIGPMAFYNTWLSSVVIPSSVTNIGFLAFYNCSFLKTVTISNGVTAIGKDAFAGCVALKSVTIPDSVTTLDYGAFGNNHGLTEILVGSGNTHYCSVDGVLFNKNKTEILQYPAGKTTTSYEIPAGVTTICEDAFIGCTSLESVTIPDGVATIGFGAFDDCTSLKSVTIPDTVTTMNNAAFSGCTSLTKVTIPKKVTTIGNGTFRDCTSLTEVMIPVGITSIGISAFEGCTSLRNVYYSGSEEEWSRVEITEDDQALLDAIVTYNYCAEQKDEKDKDDSNFPWIWVAVGGVVVIGGVALFLLLNKKKSVE